MNLTLNLSQMYENISSISSYSNCKCVVPEASLPLSWRLFIIVNLVFTGIVYSKMFFLSNKLELKFTREQISKFAYAFASIVVLYVYLFTLIDFLTRANTHSLLFKIVIPVYLAVGYLLFRKLSKDFPD